MDKPAKLRGFPAPSSLKVLPGTERAQAAYPYYVQFTEADDERFWFYNSMHFPEPMSAFDMVTAEAAYCALGAANTRVHCLPTTLGIDHRIINGRVYIGGNAVTDPAEIARRTEEFQKRAFYYYANWERLYAQWREKMLALIRDAQALPAPALPEFEPLEHVHAGRGVASNHQLLDIYQKTLEGYFRMWHHHFEFLLLGYGAYMTFFAFCKKAFPEITDQTIARMVAGIEAEIFRPDEELRRLARKAVELGVDSAFQEGVSADDIIRTLEQSGEPGRQWIAELSASRDPWFNINVGDGFYHYHRSWNDDLSMPFSGLPDYVSRVRAGESLERPVEKLQAERRQLIEDYRELLSTDDERAAYDQMIALAHRVFPYVEGHKFYCEHWYTNLFFNKIREFGALLAAHGFFPGAEDVFQLTHYELEAAIIDLMNAWSTGSSPRGPDTLAGHRGGTTCGDCRMGQARHAARPRAGAGRDRRPGNRDALGHHARESRHLAERGRRRDHQRAAWIRRVQRSGRRPCAGGQVGGGDRASAQRRHPRLPGHQSRPGRRCFRKSPARCPTSEAR